MSLHMSMKFQTHLTNTMFTLLKKVAETTLIKQTLVSLKLVSAIFYQIFISHQIIALQKLGKILFCFLFHVKSSFHSRDI